MSYKYSKGSSVQGDIKAADDSNRDTQIDFGEDSIKLDTAGSTRFKISGSSGGITFNEEYTFPTADGNADQVLRTDGNGSVSWATQSGGGGGSASLVVGFSTLSGASGSVDHDCSSNQTFYHNQISGAFSPNFTN